MIKEIAPETLYNNIVKGEEQIIIDVRSPDSFKDWNIFNSKNIPFKLFQSREYENLIPKSEKSLVVVCNRGNDSKLISNYLNQNGILAESLKGGMLAWNNILHPVKIRLTNSNFEIFQFQRLAKGCLSYVIVKNGEAAIIDPLYNIDTYIRFIEENGIELKYIFETHLHADHVSGSRVLQEKTDANLFLCNKDPFSFDYSTIIHEKSIYLGNDPLIYPIHTPGHTKGSTSYKIDNSILITGDTIFIDSLGRPDLADRAIEFAHDLYGTIKKKILKMSDNLQITPAHHGKLEKEHMKTSLIAPILKMKKFSYFDLNEEEFVEEIVKQTNKTERPAVYEKIIRINSGIEAIQETQIKELEMGANKCAITK